MRKSHSSTFQLGPGHAGACLVTASAPSVAPLVDDSGTPAAAPCGPSLLHHPPVSFLNIWRRFWARGQRPSSCLSWVFREILRFQSSRTGKCDACNQTRLLLNPTP